MSRKRTGFTGISEGGIHIFKLQTALAYLFDNPIINEETGASSITSYKTLEENQSIISVHLAGRDGLPRKKILEALVKNESPENVLHYLKTLCNEAKGEDVFDLSEFEAETKALMAKIDELGLGKKEVGESKDDSPSR